MPTVKIRPGAGDEETIAETTEWTRTREIGVMRRMRITVERALANAVTLNEKDDLVELVGVDTMRLVDVETGGPTQTLVCYSLEWDSNRTTPTDGGTVRSGSDQDLITTAIGNVATWSAGTVNEIDTGLEFVFNHASPAETIRRVEKNVSGEVQFRDEGTVDYTARIGSDKSGTVELSSAQGNIEEEINITKRGRELDGTHFRVLGAHEGEAQLFVNLVPADDSATYENRVNYTTSRWSDGDTRDWDRWTNKDVTDQTTLEAEAAALGDEITESLVEATATADDSLSADIGDTVQVVKADADLDRSMRIHRIKEVAKNATKRLHLLLSTRTTARQDAGEELRDIQRFNSGFQGSSVALTGGPVTDGIEPGDPIEFAFRYPDIEFENNAELHIQGMEYRVDADPVAHDHDLTVTHPSHDHNVTHPSHNHSVSTTSTDNSNFQKVAAASSSGKTVTISQTGMDTLFSFSESTAHSELFVFVQLELRDGTQGTVPVAVRLENTATGEYYPSSFGEGFGALGTNRATNAYLITIPADVSGDTIEIQAETQQSSQLDVFTVYNYWVIGKHTHDVSDTSTTALGTTETSTTALGTTETSTSDTTAGFEAGIFKTGDTASGIDVDINGTTVATDIGNGTFETVIDIDDDMTPGTWNDFTLTTDSGLGRLRITPFVQGYDQIGKQ
jgi:hypothetical protein